MSEDPQHWRKPIDEAAIATRFGAAVMAVRQHGAALAGAFEEMERAVQVADENGMPLSAHFDPHIASAQRAWRDERARLAGSRPVGRVIELGEHVEAPLTRAI